MRRLLLLAALGLATAGCGTHGASGPRLRPKIGQDLLAQAKRVETLLEDGKPCAAAGAAASLQTETIALINRGLVQPRLQEPLLAKVNGTAGSALCVKGRKPPPHARERVRDLRAWLEAH